MYSCLNPGTLGLWDLPFEQVLQLAVEHGFGGVSFPSKGIETPAKARELGQRVRDAGLRWGLFWQPCDFFVCSDDDFARGLSRLEALLPLVEAAGCTRTYNHIYPGSDSHDFEANRQRHLDRLGRIMPLLRDRGVRLGLEFIGPAHFRLQFRHAFIHTLDQTLELAADAGPGVGIVLDTFHWYCGGGQFDSLDALNDGNLVTIHLNDAMPGIPPDRQHNKQRAMPGATGVIDAPAVLRTLDAKGYAGPVICEPFEPTVSRFRTMDPEAVVAEAGLSLHAMLDRAGVRPGESTAR